MLDGLRAIDGFAPVVVEVWGPAALFTRPEAKVERLSYPVMTPSAAVGVLEAIFWKPEFSWQIQAIEVLNPINEATVRRNETEQVVTLRAALGGQRADTSTSRTQRSTTYLKDVRYRVHAHVVLRARANEPVAKYRDQFRRRVTKGACFSQPYLGTREFVACFGAPTSAPPIRTSADLGIMLHSIAFEEAGAKPQSSWFTARLDNGVMHVPERGIRVGDLL